MYFGLWVELFKIDKLVLYEFNVSNTFKPEIYNEPFILVVLSKLVNALTFNEDSIVVLLFKFEKTPLRLKILLLIIEFLYLYLF